MCVCVCVQHVFHALGADVATMVAPSELAALVARADPADNHKVRSKTGLHSSAMTRSRTFPSQLALPNPRAPSWGNGFGRVS